jgi:hypothetical protein
LLAVVAEAAWDLFDYGGAGEVIAARWGSNKRDSPPTLLFFFFTHTTPFDYLALIFLSVTPHGHINSTGC